MPEIGKLILISGAASFALGFVLACILYGRLVHSMAGYCRKLEEMLQSRRNCNR